VKANEQTNKHHRFDDDTRYVRLAGDGLRRSGGQQHGKQRADCKNRTGETGEATKAIRWFTGGDLDFMNQAAPGGMAEVELGRMAASQGMSKEVKTFGQKMVEDHSKANQELMQVAQQKKVKLSSDLMPAHQETMEKTVEAQGRRIRPRICQGDG
jgi:predicted outer membrane protein